MTSTLAKQSCHIHIYICTPLRFYSYFPFTLYQPAYHLKTIFLRHFHFNLSLSSSFLNVYVGQTVLSLKLNIFTLFLRIIFIFAFIQHNYSSSFRCHESGQQRKKKRGLQHAQRCQTKLHNKREGLLGIGESG